jgi:hypothetical protein
MDIRMVFPAAAAFLASGVALFAIPVPIARAETPQIDAGIFISEIQIEGGQANDEFVELFNASDRGIDLGGWKLKKRTRSGTESSVKAFSAGTVIPARGHLLWANSQGFWKDAADQISSTTLTADNSLGLFGPDNSLVDAVLWGSGHVAPFAPATAYPENPRAGTSIERNSSTLAFTLQDRPSPRGSRTPAPTSENTSRTGGGSAGSPSVPSQASSSVSEERPRPDGPASVRLNEVFPDPSGKSEEGEFIELHNFGTHDVSLENWTLRDASVGGKHLFQSGVSIRPGEHLVFWRKETGIALNNDEEMLSLLEPGGGKVSSLSYQKASEGQAYAWNGSGWQWTDTPSPGEANDFPKLASGGFRTDGIRIHELLPDSPDKGEKTEFVEIFNGSGEDIDLKGWSLRIGSGKEARAIPEHVVVRSGGFAALYRSVSGLSLPNSGGSAFLFDPEGNLVDTVDYGKSKEGRSYGLVDGTWRWSPSPTPGEANRRNEPPSLSVKKPGTVSPGKIVAFRAVAKDPEKERLTYAWDFGDGSKSRVPDPRHSYKKNGRYSVSLAVSDGIDKVRKKFSIRVGGPAAAEDIRIVQVSPDPAGADAGREWITLENRSRRSVNLKGWKVASGRDKLSNHPIRKDFVIKPNASRKLTGEFSSFGLNNTKGRVVIVAPNGKKGRAVAYESATEGQVLGY